MHALLLMPCTSSPARLAPRLQQRLHRAGKSALMPQHARRGMRGRAVRGAQARRHQRLVHARRRAHDLAAAKPWECG